MFLKDGSTIAFTQSAIVLETLVNKFFANFASKGDSSNGGDSSGNKDSSSDSGGDAGKEKQK